LPLFEVLWTADIPVEDLSWIAVILDSHQSLVEALPLDHPRTFGQPAAGRQWQ